MVDYKAPLRDIQFVLGELLNSDDHYASLPNGDALSPDVLAAILEEAAKFSEHVLAPLNAVGDQEGCQWRDFTVTTPAGFKEAYRQYCEGGWPSLNAVSDYGGQGLPGSLAVIVNELVGSANWAWGMYPGLTAAAARCLDRHGNEQQKNTYLSKLVSGEWSGTMCLTEAHAGSDLGMIKTRAEKVAADTFEITGSKIFISGGEHDLTDNIVHLVLARIIGAPEGTKGISLFVVPKYLLDGKRNDVQCGSIEHKMGINGSSTCVMNFDGAIGYLVGEENHGLQYMFTMMNAARIGTAIQGLALAEAAYQRSLAYAKDRLQMRSLTGAKNVGANADPIIVHSDVRRMLLTQKAFVEGSRALIYYLALAGDQLNLGGDEAEQADDLQALLTPIAKAFVTETGFESVNLALQVFGGHGYIREWGVEQLVRDARISMVYEGTTGIQSLDLLGRKVLQTRGDLLRKFTEQIHKYCRAKTDNKQLAEFIEPLARLNTEWGELTQQVGMKALKNAEEVGAAAVDYLMYSGYITLAYMWVQMAEVAQEKIQQGNTEKIYSAKIKTAEFYFQRILPRTAMHKQAMLSGVNNLQQLTVEEF